MNDLKSIPRVSTLKTPADFRAHVASLDIDLKCDDAMLTGDASPLTKPFTVYGQTVGNRWAVHPMEGWDATTTGAVTEPMRRRWQRFGESGAKLIWSGEAMAVREDGRANPNQLMILPENEKDIAGLRDILVKAHGERYGKTNDLMIGFQLTHSGRFCRPRDKKKLESRVAYRHPILDKKFNVTSDAQVLTDGDIQKLRDAFVAAAKIAKKIGAHFIDIKHCHGYLLHEFLGAYSRPGIYGGAFENRTRFFKEIVEGIRAEAPGLHIGVRLSAFDFVPYKPDPARAAEGKLGPGIPEDYAHCLPYTFGFSVNPKNPVAYDLSDTFQFLNLLLSLKIELVNLSAGSPYYNPHIQRPALFPPSDGYQPPEDPLVGVARQINAVKAIKQKFPSLKFVGSAYSYLQEFLPLVAQHYVREGDVDSVGLGRMVLSYPHMLADATTKGTLERKLICRTFSDCTTAPRNGLPSGCFPLDEYYKKSPEAAQLKAIKGEDK